MLSAVAPSGDDNDIVYDAVNQTTWAAYYDPAVLQLKVRSRVDGGVWSAETILDQTPAKQVGRLPSIAVAPNGTVGVAYYDASDADLRYVERNPSTGVWTSPVTVESSGRVGNYPSLAFNSKNNPFISYWTDVTNGTDFLKLRWREAGVWDSSNTLTIDSGADVGRYSDLVFQPSIGWAMAYVTGTGCKYAQQNGSGVTVQTVDSSGAPAYTSLAFDGSNKPWVSYYRSSNTQVNVAVRGTSWTTQSVFGNKGYYTNLWFEPNGADARLVFYDPSAVQARRFNYASGVWQTNSDPTTVLFAGGGDNISAARGANGAISFTSVASIQTAAAPAVYSKVLQLRDDSDADIGKTWATVTQSPTQPAPNTSGPTVLMNGVMYMVNQTSSTRDDVWTSSDNGVTWSNVTAALSGGAAFGMRNDESLVVFNNELWVIGGRGGFGGTTYLDDVWHSADGVTWTQAAAGAFHARSHPGAGVFNGRMYVMGGYYFDGLFDHRLDDVWSSADGVTWQADVSSGAPFGKIDSMSVVTYNQRLWIIGGTVGGLSPVSNYVWSSADGQTWVQANVGNSSLPPRTSGSAFALDNRLWLVGGQDGVFGVVDSVYYSLDGATWVLAGSLPNARATDGAFVLNDQMWLVGGNTTQGATNDVLHSNP